MELSPEAERAIQKRGLMRPGGRIARRLAAERVGEFLVQQPDGASVDSIAVAVFGTTEPVVRRIAAQLTTLDGPVQKWINGRGGVLVIRREKEVLTDKNGNPVPRTVSKRYVTKNPDEIWKDLMLPLADRNILSAERAARIIRDFVLPRRPELKSRLEEFKALLTTNVAEKLAALPSPETAAD